jgi:hypothetical protein
VAIASGISGQYLLAGDFSLANGHASDGLIAFDLQGTIDTAKSLDLEDAGIAGRPPYISSLSEDGSGRLYLAGEFRLDEEADGLLCLNSDWSRNRDFEPEVGRVDLLQRFAPKLYPKIQYSDGLIHLKGPYREEGKDLPFAYWQLEAVDGMSLPEGQWFDQPLLGFVYGYTETMGASANMGTVYTGAWPWLYIFENNWGWMVHLFEDDAGRHYFYHSVAGWILYHPENEGWYQASASDWEWRSFLEHSPED